MCTNVSLYNTYLKGVRIGGSGFPRIWPPACGSRASKIWWGYRVQVFDFRAVLLGSLHSSLELSVWPFAFLLFCLIFYSLYLLAINHNMKRLWDTVHMLQPMFISLLWLCQWWNGVSLAEHFHLQASAFPCHLHFDELMMTTKLPHLLQKTLISRDSSYFCHECFHRHKRWIGQDFIRSAYSCCPSNSYLCQTPRSMILIDWLDESESYFLSH